MAQRKKYVGIIAGIVIFVLVIIAVRYGASKKVNSLYGNQVPNSRPQVSQTLPTGTPSQNTLKEETIPMISPPPALVAGGISRGQITCNYRIPAAPNQYGVVSLESNWNNLVLGKNASAKVSVCVSVNGNSSLISSDNQINGSRIDNAPWISLNTDYIFTLYDDHGGDLPDCGGVVLSTCQLNTKNR